MSVKIPSILALSVSIAIAAPAIWNGTADVSWYDASAQAYNLTTAEQLAGLAQLVNNGNAFAGKTITLGADIFLNDTTGINSSVWENSSRKKWTPIGSYYNPFKGEFDGIAGKNNRKIYGLYIKNASSNNMGLFGYTDSVKFSNLDILGGYIMAKNNTGALVGYANGGTISNVHSDINVTGGNHVGGLVGYSKATITTCSAKGTIAGQDSVGGLVGVTTGPVKNNTYFVGQVTGRKYVGGLAGSGENVSKSYVEGAVKGDSSYVGGIAGYANGNLDSVYHIAGDVNGSGYVGGIVGTATGNVRNSYSKGNVTGKSSNIGGLAGYISGSLDKSYHIEGNVSGKDFVGGIAGFVEGHISNSYSEGIVTGNGDYVGGVAGNVLGIVDSVHHIDGEVKGMKYVGGLIGSAAGNIKGAYSEGNVSGKAYVGGALGTIDSSASLSNVYTVGNIIADSSYVGGVVGYALGTIDSVHHREGDVTGDDYVGGVAGYAKESIDSAHHIGGDVNGYGYVGGLAGRVDGIVTRSYAEGIVSGGQLSHHNHKSYVGGLVGFGRRIVSSFHNNGSVLGDGGYVGGLAGYIYGNNNRDIPEISNSYNLGDVECLHMGAQLCERTGGIVGELYQGEITDSYSEGLVRSDRDYVGGLIGYSHYRYVPNVKWYHCGSSGNETICYDNEPDGSPIYYIKNSHFKGDVHGRSYVGGLVGFDTLEISPIEENPKTVATINRIILKSHSEGNVYGSSYLGGLVGKSVYVSKVKFEVVDQLDSCYHIAGNIGVSSDAYSSYRGGIAGETYYNISNSYSKGNVLGYSFLGGLVGFLRNVNSSANKTIRNSFSEGNVDGYGTMVGGLIGDAWSVNIYESHSIGDVNGGSYTGGLIGYHSTSGNGNRVSSSYSLSSVKGGTGTGGLIGYGGVDVSNSYSIGSVTGGDSCVGGIAGYVKSVSGSYFSGNVVGKRKYVGGVAGYATGIIKSSYHIAGSVEGKTYVGGVAGKVDGTVKSVYHNKGDVKGDSSYSYVGGTIGYAGNSIDSASFKEGSVSGGTYVGGVVGYASKSVRGSFSEGDVTGAKKYIGGLAGQVGGVIVDSYSEGDVKTSDDQVGGLVGQIEGSIDNSYSEGNVFGLDSIGGLAGVVKGYIKNSYAKAVSVKGRNAVGGLVGYGLESVQSSYFNGDSVTGIYQVGGLAGYLKSVVDSSYSTANVKGDDNIGGLIGSAYNDVSNSYALGNVIGDTDNSSAGNDNLGGLIGYHYNGAITKSMAIGDVFGTTKIGGLVGRFDGTSISQSYANGNVTGGYYGNPADEVGNYYIGGLIGYAKGSLTESYASGVVKGMEEEPIYTGCIVGYVNGSFSVSESYYDKTKCDLGVDGGENAANVFGTSGKTTAEMQTQSTFANWDFTNTWNITTDMYPYLWMLSNNITIAEVSTESLEGIIYDGSPKTPSVVSVLLHGQTLTYGSDYTVSYKNNVNAGTASINICGINFYHECKEIYFKILPMTIEPTIGDIANVTYTGEAWTPEISVYNGTELFSITDYTIAYSNNVNAGMATVYATLKGNYSGTVSKAFLIEKATPVILQNPLASEIKLGETLSSSELVGGEANVFGKFVWKLPKTIPQLNSGDYAVVFVPTDTINYTNSAETLIPIRILDVVNVVVHFGNKTIDSAIVAKDSSYILPRMPDSVGYFAVFYEGDIQVGYPRDEIAVSENMVIEARYNISTFPIIFRSKYGFRQEFEYAYGTVPVPPSVPLPENTADYTYRFVGWEPEISVVTDEREYVAIIRMESVHYSSSSSVSPYVSSSSSTLQNSSSDSETELIIVGNLEQTVMPGNPIESVTFKNVQFYNRNSFTMYFLQVSKVGNKLVISGEVPEFYQYGHLGETMSDDIMINGNVYRFKLTFGEAISSSSFSSSSALQSSSSNGMSTFFSSSSTGKDHSITHVITESKSHYMVYVNNRYLHISTAAIGMNYTLFDLQGRVLKRGVVSSPNFNVNIKHSGNYLFQIGNTIKFVNVP